MHDRAYAGHRGSSFSLDPDPCVFTKRDKTLLYESQIKETANLSLTASVTTLIINCSSRECGYESIRNLVGRLARLYMIVAT